MNGPPPRRPDDRRASSSIWLVGAAVTTYSARADGATSRRSPSCVVGATIGVVLLWVKIVLAGRQRRVAETARHVGDSRLRANAPQVCPAERRPMPVAVRRAPSDGSVPWLDDATAAGRLTATRRVEALAERARRLRDRRPPCSSAAARRRRRRARVPRRGAARRTTRSCSETWQAAVERIRAAIAAGERICVHGDYDVDGICATALAVLALRELGADVELAPAEPFRGGLRPRARDDRAARRGRRRPRRSPSTAASPPSRRSRGRGSSALDVIVTDHHRPGDDAARLPDRRHAALDVPVSRALRDRRRLQARRGAARRRAPGARPHLDLVALATIADVVPLVDENRALATAGLRRSRARKRPGLRALMRVGAASTRPSSTRPPSASGSRRGSTPPGGSAGPRSRSSSSSPTTAREADALAASSRTLNRDRQAVEERILREAIARVDALAAPSSRRDAATSSGARTGTRA